MQMMTMQRTRRGFPYFDSPVYRTEDGTPYLKCPGVALIKRPDVDLDGILSFLSGFDADLGFETYLHVPGDIDLPTQLLKFCGQLCYLSLGNGRTPNSVSKVNGYFCNIKSSGHGSLLEHADFTFLFWGIDRSATHELVRHRAGMAYSQVSQRYVDGSRLRFVERPEFQVDLLPADTASDVIESVSSLHEQFEGFIDLAREEYESRAFALLRSKDMGHPMLQGGGKTEARKQVNQAARENLPNCTEAPIAVSANVRAWRHFLEMRASPHADVQIRTLALLVYYCLRDQAPVLFSDYEIVFGEGSSSASLKTPYRKV